MKKNAILSGDIADRIAQQALSRRGASYAAEVRRLLDAALQVMSACGTATRPRVTDIVTAAGLSNDAFYRYFPSKEALVTALLEDGADRLGSYLAHQMAKEPAPEEQVRRWVEGVLTQTDEKIATTTLAVLWNAGSSGEGLAAGRHPASAPLATLLHGPFTALGSTTPALDASLAAHAVLGRLSDHLWQRTTPTPAEVERMVTFCLAATTVQHQPGTN
ncbi:TetR/AcrR family transcriptional regulator [Actinomadura craniellae]|uniref:TetR/AcrR family transcriptional regulator n=1 Tax=Actinomadura craniellae TaxID=2231787 RepID=A0A365H6B5_9ACTN|nr:TetR/AcrR family transcriptional regulator [Actinomadura craniellae]RAY14654.1 TetR/AcrR family transcriptional regulator [Actinomadura craniellae]